MSDLAIGILDSLRAPDRRPITEWAVGNVILPHSQQAREWAEDTAYWLIEPINAIIENECVSLCKPTQTGGTTAYEVFLTWLISQAPQNVAMMGQTDDDAKALFREKILPTLRASPATTTLMATAARNAITVSSMNLGNMIFSVHGPGKNSMQSASKETLLLDEAWLFPLGTIGEIIERTSTREATRKIVTVSQAGEELVDKHGKPMWDEWGGHWHKGTQEVYKVVCPFCHDRFEPRTEDFRTAENARDPLTKVWDWRRVTSTTYLQTPCCKEKIESTETNRRSLSATGKYFVTNQNADPRHRSFRYSSWVVYWQDWGNLMKMFLRAQEARKQGNMEPLKIWTQKKEARWWMQVDQEIPLDVNRLSWKYKMTEYAGGDAWESADFRFLGADYQQDCFKVVIRDFAVGGASRLIWQGTVRDWGELAHVAARYRVPESHVCVDASNWTQDVYRECAKRNWIAMHGSAQSKFVHIVGNHASSKPHSKLFRGKVTTLKKNTGGVKPQGKPYANYVQWSNLIYKDWLTQLHQNKGVAWEYADDIDEEYVESLDCRRRITGKSGKALWERIGKRRDHFDDSELMILVRANMAGSIFVSVPEPDDDDTD